MFSCKNNSLLWGSRPNNLQIAFTVYIVREKKQDQKCQLYKGQKHKTSLPWDPQKVFIWSSLDCKLGLH